MRLTALQQVSVGDLKRYPPEPKTKAHDRDRTGDLFLTKEVLHP